MPNEATYVKIGKPQTGKVPKEFEAAARRGVVKGIEKFVKAASKDGFSPKPGKDKKKGFAVWAVVNQLTVDDSSKIDCKVEVHVAHLPQEVRTKAKITGGGGLQGTPKGIEGDVEYCLETVIGQAAKGRVLKYMKANRGKL